VKRDVKESEECPGIATGTQELKFALRFCENKLNLYPGTKISVHVASIYMKVPDYLDLGALICQFPLGLVPTFRGVTERVVGHKVPLAGVTEGPGETSLRNVMHICE
jgi:hypothetical protein